MNLPLPAYIDPEAWNDDGPVSHAKLLQLFTYNPETGEFNRLIHVGGARKKPSVKYRAICIDGKTYGVHRMAWLYMTGKWPRLLIDHINGDTTDNRFCNLRPATHQQNMWNAVHPVGASGFRGVSKVHRKFRAFCTENNKRRHLGYFDTAEQAFRAVIAYKAERRGNFDADIGRSSGHSVA